MPGSMSHWDPSSFSGIASSRGVENFGTPQKNKDCKGCGRFDPTTTAGAKTQLRCIQNDCQTNNLGGSNKKRKTKMQKKRKNRRTKKSTKR
jgi:hypothetical protein